jgi:hypothetical protein
MTKAREQAICGGAEGIPASLDFFGHLRWLDGRPLLDTIEEYRRAIFTAALDTYGPDGRPRYNLILAGRGKKNAKSLDLILAALFGAGHPPIGAGFGRVYPGERR